MAHRTVRDDPSDVDGVTLWIDEMLDRGGIEPARRNAIGVCIEEALANLIGHGHAAHGDKAIGITIEVDTRLVTLVIDDACVPYDIVTATLPERLGQDAIRSGGHGLRLIRGLATTVGYASTNGRNALTLTFARSDPRVDR